MLLQQFPSHTSRGVELPGHADSALGCSGSSSGCDAGALQDPRTTWSPPLGAQPAFPRQAPRPAGGGREGGKDGRREGWKRTARRQPPRPPATPAAKFIRHGVRAPCPPVPCRAVPCPHRLGTGCTLGPPSSSPARRAGGRCAAAGAGCCSPGTAASRCSRGLRQQRRPCGRVPLLRPALYQLLTAWPGDPRVLQIL